MNERIDEGARSLRCFLGIDANAGHAWKADVLDQLTDERMVIRYTLYPPSHRSRPGFNRQFVGKFYTDEAGQSTLDAMRNIASVLNKDESVLAIPAAIYYDSQRRFLVQEHVQATPFADLLDRPAFADYFRLAGRALAVLHSRDLMAGEVRWIGDHIAELIRPDPAALYREYPEYRERIVTLLERLHAREAEVRDSIVICPLHRDFHLRQLFHESGRVWVVDWDLFARGDPAFDVAYFVVYLKNHLMPGKCPAATEAFLEGYFESRPREILARVPLYEAFNYLRRACRRFRLRDHEWQVQMRRMLAHIEHLFF